MNPFDPFVHKTPHGDAFKVNMEHFFALNCIETARPFVPYVTEQCTFIMPHVPSNV